MITVEMQSVAMGLLQNLAATSENCITIDELGGAETMMQAMLRFPDHPEIQKNGCGALRNLAFDSANAAAVVQLEGVQLVLDAMRRHSSVANVQQNACGCLQNLASTSPHRALLLSQGAVGAILSAMRRFRVRTQAIPATKLYITRDSSDRSVVVAVRACCSGELVRRVGKSSELPGAAGENA